MEDNTYIKDFSYLRANKKYAQYGKRKFNKSQEEGRLDVIPKSPQEHPYRSVFACDRDRVMYCSSFRRLSSKTQIFHAQKADGLRTRLTHTLEVAQIARTISRQLGLDEDLTEAIALGHDLGHTPFGHVGERVLNDFSKKVPKQNIEVAPKNWGFKHNLQSVRVLVEYSEKVRFSNYMLFGVREHTKQYWKEEKDVAFYNRRYEKYCSYIDNDDKLYPAWSFEAFVVKWADQVAQRHHDIEDAFLQNIMPPQDIIHKVEILSDNKYIKGEPEKYKYIKDKFSKLKDEVKNFKKKDVSAFSHTLSSFLVDAYVTILIEEFSAALRKFSKSNEINNEDDFERKFLNIDIKDVRKYMDLQDSEIYHIDKQLEKNLKFNIIDSYEVQRMDGKGAYITRKLFYAYWSNPQQLPNQYVNIIIKKELKYTLNQKDYKYIRKILKDEMETTKKERKKKIRKWKDYECREALRIICKRDRLKLMAQDALIRVIFDYIAGMTDSFADLQYKELY